VTSKAQEWGQKEASSGMAIIHAEWFCGTGQNGLSDENAKYFYHELIGPNLPAPAFQNENVYFGPLEMKSGYTYPAHNHPAPEIYYVI